MGLMRYFSRARKGKGKELPPADVVAAVQQQLDAAGKKEEYFQRKVDEETKRARANVVSNKVGTLPFKLLLCYAVISECGFVIAGLV